MSADINQLLAELSRADIEKLLAAKDEVESLEQRRAELLKELAGVEKKLAQVVGRAVGAGKTARKVAKKTAKKVAKKAAKKRTKKTTKKTTKKVAKKAAKKSTKKAARKAVKKTAKKTAAKAARGGKVAKKPRLTLESVVCDLLTKRGEPVTFKDIHATIVGEKLYASKAGSFENVLRRTLSTSERIKRVGRGLYSI
jgi:ABC-type transporter Mla subunit MlaD